MRVWHAVIVGIWSMYVRLGLVQNGLSGIVLNSSRLVGGCFNKGVLITLSLAMVLNGREGGRFLILCGIFMCCRSQGRNNVDREGCGEQGDAVDGPCY